MKQKRSKLSVDVGIPALNESTNIMRMLRSVSRQRETNFQLNKIRLVSDGSTDNTVELAKSLKLPNLKIIENRKPEGQPQCWYKLFQASTADVLVLLDADIELSHKDVITNLVEPMIDNEHITLTSGRPVKQSTGSFTDRIMDVSLRLQDYIKSHVANGSSVYACHGRIVAVKREIFSQITKPRHRLGNDSFLYFFNKTHRGEFRYAPGATVTFKMPQAFGDFSRQERRFAKAQASHAELFGNWIYAEYKIPSKYLLGALFHSFLVDPVHSTSYLVFRIRSKFFGNNVITNSHWEVPTTKRLD